MYIQILNDRIVGITEEYSNGFIEFDIPDDFDFENISRYEVKGTELIKHDLPNIETAPTLNDRLKQLEEALTALLEGETE